MGLYPLLYVGLDIRLLNLLNMTLIKTALSLLKKALLQIVGGDKLIIPFC